MKTDSGTPKLSRHPLQLKGENVRETPIFKSFLEANATIIEGSDVTSKGAKGILKSLTLYTENSKDLFHICLAAQDKLQFETAMAYNQDKEAFQSNHTGGIDKIARRLKLPKTWQQEAVVLWWKDKAKTKKKGKGKKTEKEIA